MMTAKLLNGESVKNISIENNISASSVSEAIYRTCTRICPDFYNTFDQGKNKLANIRNNKQKILRSIYLYLSGRNYAEDTKNGLSLISIKQICVSHHNDSGIDEETIVALTEDNRIYRYKLKTGWTQIPGITITNDLSILEMIESLT